MMSRFCLAVFCLLALAGSVTGAHAQRIDDPATGKEAPRDTRARLVDGYKQQYEGQCLPLLMPQGIGAVNQCDAALQAEYHRAEAEAGLPYMSLYESGNGR